VPSWFARARQALANEPRLGGQRAWLLWIAVLALVTLGMLGVQSSLREAHVALAYLLVVLGAGASGGRVLGLTLAGVSFGCFTFFFVPPYHTFAVTEPLDWLVLVAFLATSAVAAQLLALAQNQAAAARERAAEVDRLSSLGSEALNAGRAEEALVAIADVIRGTLDTVTCEIYLRDEPHHTVTLAARSSAKPATDAELTRSREAPIGLAGADRERLQPTRPPGMPGGDRLVEWVAESGRTVSRRADGTTRFADAGLRISENTGFNASGAGTLFLPLRVRGRTVGVLCIEHTDPRTLDPPRLRFLEALAYYAALGVERVRLVAEAEHADALREADRLKDALLASVSHDLRTPLTTIKALAHSIGAEGDERAVTIEQEADRLNRFVADLLDLSRLAGGALTVTPELTAADDLLGAAWQRVSGALGDRVLEVSLDPAEPLLVGRFDFVHSLRVLVNLIENALKYSPGDAPVELAARRAGDTLEFLVDDRGAGIAVAERERIFEPFYRPSDMPADTNRAGLGLSISRRLAEAQGGSLRYEPREGGGSRFVYSVPAADLTTLEAARAR
jgi:two-component system sensor histidine kinase KdpD